MIVRPEKGRGPLRGAGTFGLALYLASRTMVFGASLIAYAVVRVQAPHWPPPGAPSLPPLLWAATAALLAGSGTMAGALAAVRRGMIGALKGTLIATLALAFLYLAIQALAWRQLVAAQAPPASSMFAFTFYMLTGLHAAHVIGGVVPLAVVTVRALLGQYSWAHHPGVRLVAIYWHFLDVVWLVIFGVLAFV